MGGEVNTQAPFDCLNLLNAFLDGDNEHLYHVIYDHYGSHPLSFPVLYLG